MLVSLDDLFHVLVANGALAGDIFAAQAFAQDVERCLKVDDQIRGGQLGTEELVVTIVNSQFVIAEVEVGEELVFLKDVIGDDDLLHTAGGGQGPQLLKAANEKSKLGLESCPGLTIVKRWEERIFLRFLHKLAMQLLG